VSGTETCTFSSNLGPLVQGISGSETDELVVTLSQRFGKSIAYGTGRLIGGNTSSPIPCDGDEHAWTVSVQSTNGAVRFRTGKDAVAQVTYKACTVLDNQLLCEQAQAQRTIAIH
jgi:hypothetical protein